MASEISTENIVLVILVLPIPEHPSSHLQAHLFSLPRLVYQKLRERRAPRTPEKDSLQNLSSISNFHRADFDNYQYL